MALLKEQGESADSLRAEYRKKMFGVELEWAFMPTRYLELHAAHELGISVVEWDRLSLEDRAEQMAHLRIANMSEIVRRHEEMQEEALKTPKKPEETSGKNRRRAR